MDFQYLSDRYEIFMAKQAFGPAQRADLYKMLAATLDNGLALKASISKLLKLYEPRKHKLVPLLRSWSRGLAEGRKFSEVLKGQIPTAELALIAAGERSNQVAEGMMQAQKATAARIAMTRAIRSSLIGPAFLLLATFGLLIGFSKGLAPILTSMFPIEKFPGHVRQLLLAADFVGNYWWAMSGALVTAAVVISWSLPNWTGPIREKADNFPPYSLYRTYNSAAFMISLSSLLRAGVALPEALRSIRALSPRWMRRHLSLSLRRLENGDSYQLVFETGMLDEQTYDLVAVYADLSDFDASIKAIGEASIENSVESIRKKSAVVKTFAMIVMGLIVGWIYSAFISVQQISSDMGKASSSITQTR